MNSIVKNIPNAITCLNLACGFLGILLAFSELTYSCYLIFLACFFDFIDGFAARMLKVSSSIGKELDSLADMVSFGVLPGIIAYSLIETAVVKEVFAGSSGFTTLLPYVSIIIPVFSGIRLARFNIDTRQVHGFIGLPTPANAIFFASLPFVFADPVFAGLINSYVFMIVVLVMSWLLVANIPLIALKFKSFRFKDNANKYILLLTSALLIGFLGLKAIPLIIVVYIIISVLFSSKEEL